MTALFEQAREERIDSPFKHLTPLPSGMRSIPARGAGLRYRVAVNRQESRVVLTNQRDRWTGAFDELAAKRGGD